MVCCAAASLVSTKNRGKARRAAIREVYSGRIGSPEKFRRVEHGLLFGELAGVFVRDIQQLAVFRYCELLRVGSAGDFAKHLLLRDVKNAHAVGRFVGRRESALVGSGRRQPNLIAPSRTQMPAAVKSWNTRCAENSTGGFK